MKQVITPAYTFNPSAHTLDLSAVQGFSLSNLYAVINNTTNGFIYAKSMPGFGIASATGAVLTFQADTTAMGAGDSLTILYDVVDTPISQLHTDLGLVAKDSSLATLHTDLGSILTKLQSTLQTKRAPETTVGNLLSPGAPISGGVATGIVASGAGIVRLKLAGGGFWDVPVPANEALLIESRAVSDIDPTHTTATGVVVTIFTLA